MDEETRDAFRANVGKHVKATAEGAKALDVVRGATVAVNSALDACRRLGITASLREHDGRYFLQASAMLTGKTEEE